MRLTMERMWVAVWVCVSATVFTGTLAIAGGHIRVRMEADRLSVDVSQADLNAVLEKITDETGVDFELQAPSKKVTRSFESLPVEKGLKLLLQAYSTSFIYTRLPSDPDRDVLSKVVILFELARDGGVSGTVRGSVDAEAAGPTQETEPAEESDLEPSADGMARQPEAPDHVPEEETKRLTELMERKMRNADEELGAVLEVLRESGWASDEPDQMNAALQKLRQQLESTPDGGSAAGDGSGSSE